MRENARHGRAGAPSFSLRVAGWLLVLIGLLLASVQLINADADAQVVPTLRADDLTVTDESSTFTVTVTLSAGDTQADSVSGVSFTLTYDPTLIQPVLSTDPFSGIVDSPICDRPSGGFGACGPLNPTTSVSVSVGQTGVWTGDVPLVELQFQGQGVAGVSPLTISDIDTTGLFGATIPGAVVNGSVTLGTAPDAPATPTPVPDSTDLTISKSALNDESMPQQPGETVTYMITGANNGPGTATDLVVTDTLPVGLSFATIPGAAGWSCTDVGQTLTCTRPDLAAEETFVFIYDALVDDDIVDNLVREELVNPSGAEPFLLTNTVTVESGSLDSDLSNNVATRTVIVDLAVILPPLPTPTAGPTATPTATPIPVPGPADLSISKTAGSRSSVDLDDSAGFSVTVINDGPGTATDVVVIDQFDDGFRSGRLPDAEGWTCSDAGQSITCTRPFLPPGESFTLAYSLRARVDIDDPTNPVRLNNVEVSASSVDPDLSNNAASAPLLVESGLATPTPTLTATVLGPSDETPEPTPTAAPTSAPGPTPTSVPLRAEALPDPGSFNNAPPTVTGLFAAPLVTIPADAVDQAAAAVVGGTGGGTTALADANTAGGGTTLAVTGSETVTLSSLSIALLAIGGLLLVAGRRKDDEALF